MKLVAPPGGYKPSNKIQVDHYNIPYRGNKMNRYARKQKNHQVDDMK